MKKIDTAWVTMPILSILALTIGDVNPWVVALIFVSGFKIFINY